MSDSIQPEKPPVAVKMVAAGTWREMVLRWLFEQSVSTVLLVGIFSLIAFGIFWGVPKYIIPGIKEGYKANADSLEKTTKMVMDSREREIKLILDLHDRDRQVMERAVRMLEERK